MFQFTVHEHPLFTPDYNDFYIIDRRIFILKSTSVKEAYKKLIKILNKRSQLGVREGVIYEGTLYLYRNIFMIVDYTPLVLSLKRI